MVASISSSVGRCRKGMGGKWSSLKTPVEPLRAPLSFIALQATYCDVGPDQGLISLSGSLAASVPPLIELSADKDRFRILQKVWGDIFFWRRGCGDAVFLRFEILKSGRQYTNTSLPMQYAGLYIAHVCALSISVYQTYMLIICFVKLYSDCISFYWCIYKLYNIYIYMSPVLCCWVLYVNSFCRNTSLQLTCMSWCWRQSYGVRMKESGKTQADSPFNGGFFLQQPQGLEVKNWKTKMELKYGGEVWKIMFL